VNGLRDRVRRFLQRPGTVDLRPYLALLPDVTGRQPAVDRLPDAGLTSLARATTDDAGICALGREAARRGLGQQPFDVQLLGTLAMLSGQIAEMATGEGKTLSGALAAAGYALRGRSVHLMTVNDYLARRDAEWMRPVYDLLGVSVGWIGQASSPEDRSAAYAAQVTYGPVSEFGFDVLRDRFVTDVRALIAGPPDVAIIDEADSVLIDEALVPLVLAGRVEAAESWLGMAEVARRLRPGLDYQTDEEGRNVYLTDCGTQAVEAALGIDLYTDAHVGTLTRVNVALHAQALLRRDVDYIVRDGKIALISPSRGRVARLQRWPDGLHAAVEAKEGLSISRSGEILDSLTIQSLVGRYPVTCGMTGTAVTVGEQLREFYGLEIAVIPPNRPCVRADEPDRLFATVAQKENALADHVASVHDTGRPVLIGTLDVAESERIATRLARASLNCTVLNAKNDAAEAAIVAEAGSRGAITVSTQMAGRGTDIRLGGTEGDHSEEIATLGGLHVVGSGRHSCARLDQQLRGRSGRQGDPGSSVFFTSMQDELVTRYAPDSAPPAQTAGDGRMRELAAKATVEHAQRVAEGVSLEIHRNTWRYNKLVEDQRRIVLEHRDRVLRAGAALPALARRSPDRFTVLSAVASDAVLAEAARQITLWHLDRAWADHLGFLAEVREGIHLRALGRGLDPLDQFHKEAVPAFSRLFRAVEERSVETFETVPITAQGADLGAAGLKRPSATWTYLVEDNPFGTDIDRALHSVARTIRTILPGR